MYKQKQKTSTLGLEKKKEKTIPGAGLITPKETWTQCLLGQEISFLYVFCGLCTSHPRPVEKHERPAGLEPATLELRFSSSANWAKKTWNSIQVSPRSKRAVRSQVVFLLMWRPHTHDRKNWANSRREQLWMPNPTQQPGAHEHGTTKLLIASQRNVTKPLHNGAQRITQARRWILREDSQNETETFHTTKKTMRHTTYAEVRHAALEALSLADLSDDLVRAWALFVWVAADQLPMRESHLREGLRNMTKHTQSLNSKLNRNTSPRKEKCSHHKYGMELSLDVRNDRERAGEIHNCPRGVPFVKSILFVQNAKRNTGSQNQGHGDNRRWETYGGRVSIQYHKSRTEVHSDIESHNQSVEAMLTTNTVVFCQRASKQAKHIEHRQPQIARYASDQMRQKSPNERGVPVQRCLLGASPWNRRTPWPASKLWSG